MRTNPGAMWKEITPQYKYKEGGITGVHLRNFLSTTWQMLKNYLLRVSNILGMSLVPIIWNNY